jgi:hypothetical protein
MLAQRKFARPSRLIARHLDARAAVLGNNCNAAGQAYQTPRTKSDRYAGGPHRRAVRIRIGGDGAVQRINHRHHAIMQVKDMARPSAVVILAHFDLTERSRGCRDQPQQTH